MLLYKTKSAYLCDTALAEGLLEETEVVLIVIFTLCIKLHLGHVDRTRKNAVHDLTVTCTCRAIHTCKTVQKMLSMQEKNTLFLF